MVVETQDKHGELVFFEIDKKEKKYWIILEGGKHVDATNDIPFLRKLDLIECPTELQDFENKLGVCWDDKKEVIVV